MEAIMNVAGGNKKIRVILVDDSRIAIAVLKRMLDTSPDIEIVGSATNGIDAMRMILELNPDLVCTDFHMPLMDGLSLTREIMKTVPRPILIVSVSVYEGSRNVFDLLEAGALDVYCKPRNALDFEFERHAAELIRKIRILSGVKVIRRWRTGQPAITESGQARSFAGNDARHPGRIAVIGASTGGPQALEHILSRLPSDFPMPVVCVQHITEGFMEGMLEWLSTKCSMRLKFAKSGEYPSPGVIYFPQEKKHLEFSDEGRFVVCEGATFEGHCPSITVTMRSAAERFRTSVIAALLTGMGKDGAEGMLAIRRAGGFTIAQDEESSIVFGMARQAIEIGGAVSVLPLNEIAGAIISYGAGLDKIL